MKFKTEIVKRKKLAKEFPGVTAVQFDTVAPGQTVVLNVVGLTIAACETPMKEIAGATDTDTPLSLITNMGGDKYLVIQSK